MVESVKCLSWLQEEHLVIWFTPYFILKYFFVGRCSLNSEIFLQSCIIIFKWVCYFFGSRQLLFYTHELFSWRRFWCENFAVFIGMCFLCAIFFFCWCSCCFSLVCCFDTYRCVTYLLSFLYYIILWRVLLSRTVFALNDYWAPHESDC